MATFLDPGNPGNYTIGGSAFSFEGEDLGNVVSATITPEIEDVAFYNAALGREAPDAFYGSDTDKVVASTRILVDLVLDELTQEALNLFFGGAAGGATDISVLSRRIITGSATIRGISVYGMEFVWSPNVCRLRAAGGISYSSDDWITLPLVLEVYPDVDTPDNPFGIMELLGLREEAV